MSFTTTTTNILGQVQPAVNSGYFICASLLGNPCDRYTASSNNNPISEIDHQDVTYVLFAFDPGFLLKKPRDYKSVQMYGCYDRTSTLVGDYLVDQTNQQIYFINSQESITPNGVILCNATFTFYRPTAQIVGGYRGNGYVNKDLNSYGGNTTNLGNPLAANWPASLILGTKGERAQVNIPNQSREPWYIAKLPIIPGVSLQTDDLVIFGIRRFLISGCELSELGLNLTLDEVDIA